MKADKKETLNKLRTSQNLYLVFSLCSRMPFVYCDPETFDDQVLLYFDKETAEKEIQTAEKEFAVTRKTVKSEADDLVELKKELEESIQESLKLRKAYEAKVDTQTLEVYHRLLAGKKGEPMAMIDQGVCGYCRLKVPPQTVNNAKKGLMTLCDNCSHLLYFPGEIED